MSDTATPHFHNSVGLKTIRIGSHAFMCIGATPPVDHPHIFLDMGNDWRIICPYCSTEFVYDATLKSGEAVPPECAFIE